MTRKFFIPYLVFGLLLMSGFLYAGEGKGIFNLKEGDWFETQFNVNNPNNNSGTNDYYVFNLRYSLVKQQSNGNKH
jgi:hypothetical protein